MSVSHIAQTSLLSAALLIGSAVTVQAETVSSFMRNTPPQLRVEQAKELCRNPTPINFAVTLLSKDHAVNLDPASADLIVKPNNLGLQGSIECIIDEVGGNRSYIYSIVDNTSTNSLSVEVSYNAVQRSQFATPATRSALPARIALGGAFSCANAQALGFVAAHIKIAVGLGIDTRSVHLFPSGVTDPNILSCAVNITGVPREMVYFIHRTASGLEAQIGSAH